jgi:hypothetical protein
LKFQIFYRNFWIYLECSIQDGAASHLREKSIKIVADQLIFHSTMSKKMREPATAVGHYRTTPAQIGGEKTTAIFFSRVLLKNEREKESE